MSLPPSLQNRPQRKEQRKEGERETEEGGGQTEGRAARGKRRGRREIRDNGDIRWGDDGMRGAGASTVRLVARIHITCRAARRRTGYCLIPHTQKTPTHPPHSSTLPFAHPFTHLRDFLLDDLHVVKVRVPERELRDPARHKVKPTQSEKRQSYGDVQCELRCRSTV